MSALGLRRPGLGTDGAKRVRRPGLGSLGGGPPPPVVENDFTFPVTEYLSKKPPPARVRE